MDEWTIARGVWIMSARFREGALDLAPVGLIWLVTGLQEGIGVLPTWGLDVLKTAIGAVCTLGWLVISAALRKRQETAVQASVQPVLSAVTTAAGRGVADLIEDLRKDSTHALQMSRVARDTARDSIDSSESLEKAVRSGFEDLRLGQNEIRGDVALLGKRVSALEEK